MMARLKRLEECQWWKPEQLHEERERQLRLLIQTIYNDVPFYRELMDQRGLCPSDIKGVADLPKLPIMTKQMLRSQSIERITRNTGYSTYDACSSGSTGQPFCIKEDSETAGWYRASFLLALEWGGWQSGEPHLQTGMTLSRPQGRRLTDVVLHTYYVSAYDLSDSRLEANLKLIERHSLQYLMGYPGSLYYLALHAMAQGWNQPLKAIYTWGDTLLESQRAVIEKAFGAKVYDQYGCAEGIQVSAQCGANNGYHVHALDVIVEYVDDFGNPVSPDQVGNLLLTRLHPGPTPLVRYKVGDLGIAGNQNPCSCGRGFELMAAIRGRESDVIITPSGNRLIVHYFTGIIEYFTQVEAFQVVQTDSDTIILRIVPSDGYTPEIGRQIVSLLQARGAADLRIEIELVSEIPLTAGGKRRFVIRDI